LEIELFKIGILKKEGIEKKFEEYIKTSPNYLVFLLVGNFYKEQRNFVKAAEYFQKAIAADGNSVTSYYHLAEVEARTGDKSTALVHLQKAIEINPYFVKAYRALGSLYEEEKDYLAARSIYNKGLRYAPEDSTLLNNLAWINLVHFADKAGAYLLLRKAINLAPDDPDIQDSLGWWYYLNNDYHQAIALLKQSVQATPDNPLFRYHLGMASLKAGEERLALSNLKKALQLGIEKEYKAQILEIVK
jgi:tetratricopeptide (TPR) repeat protein